MLEICREGGVEGEREREDGREGGREGVRVREKDRRAQKKGFDLVSTALVCGTCIETSRQCYTISGVFCEFEPEAQKQFSERGFPSLCFRPASERQILDLYRH